MDLQTWFYVIGIVYMSLSLVLVVMVLVVFVGMVWKARQAKKEWEKRVANSVVARFLTGSKLGYGVLLWPLVRDVVAKIRRKID